MPGWFGCGVRDGLDAGINTTAEGRLGETFTAFRDWWRASRARPLAVLGRYHSLISWEIPIDRGGLTDALNVQAGRAAVSKRSGPIFGAST